MNLLIVLRIKSYFLNNMEHYEATLFNRMELRMLFLLQILYNYFIFKSQNDK